KDKLRTLDLASGAVQTLAAVTSARGGSWSHDGTILFSERAGGELDAISENGGEAKKVLGIASGTESSSVRWPTFLPGSRTFTYFSMAPNDTSLRASSLDGAKPKKLGHADSGAFLSGTTLYFTSSDRLVKQQFDARGLALTGVPQPVTDEVYWDVFSTGNVGFT